MDKLKTEAERLSAAHGIQAHEPADLSVPHAAKEVVAQLQERGLTIDVLVNNAGHGTYGPFAQADLDREIGMIELNVTALTELTGLLLPGMVERRRGRILNVASTAAFQPGPLMAVYYASKAFVLSFSEAIANELEGTGVTVTCLCPGPTQTGFQAGAKMEKSKLFQSLPVMSSKEVARAGFEALMAGKTLEVPGLLNKVSAQSPRLAPRGLVVRIVRRMQAASH